MKKIGFIAAGLLFALSVQAQQDSWLQKANFAGGSRNAVTAFSVGDRAYAGLGLDDAGNCYSDVWQYDPSSDTWSQLADFPGGARYGATGFSVGGRGYIGWGANTPGDFHWVWYTDIWQYNPGSNSWVRMHDFGSPTDPGRYFPLAFTIGNKVYAGTGAYRRDRFDFAHFLSDFWEYDPAADTWTQKPDVPEQGRFGAVGFSAGGKGYVGTGYYYYDTRLNDLWEFDPLTGTWARKADLPATPRVNAFGFGVGRRGYVSSGQYYSPLNDLWEYNPLNDIWTQRASVPTNGRSQGISFVVDGKAYIGLGSNAVGDLNDVWQYTPAPSCDSPISASVADVYAVNPGGAPNTIYVGYGPASLSLSASVTGGLQPGDQFTYAWSDGASGPVDLVQYSTPGSYPDTVTVTDQYGCVATAITTIHVVDVRCGPRDEKVAVCQSLPHKNKNVCVSSNAVRQMLSKGATLGACSDGPGAGSAATDSSAIDPSAIERSAIDAATANPSAVAADGFMVYPNPANRQVNIRLDAEGHYCYVRILD
ncbi:MAG TPA: kelch repeat-containing protein, partial [Puia sp.]|nr:kelch repeat-containing protein [Puia sp.]